MGRSARPAVLAVVLAALTAGVALAPAPPGLTPVGQRVLAVVVLAIGLWSTEALPPGLTGVVVTVALVALGAVPSLRDALSGFSEPIVFFLIGVLTIGLAVARSGLAQRIAGLFLRHARGRPALLYWQMLLLFPVLTLFLPSATTRSGILVHAYDHALRQSGVGRGAPLAKAIMLALNSTNRLASTVLLTGGITPVVAAGLIGGLSWTRWFVLMSVPYLALLGLGSVLIWARHARGFPERLEAPPGDGRTSLSPAELRAACITLGASCLWLTDALHHWHPAVPALLAWACLVAPGIGVLTWKEFERELSWASVFVIASSLSLAHALMKSGAGAWLAGLLVRATPDLGHATTSVAVALLVVSAVVRLVVPNITGFLATTIPVAMAVGTATGVSPVVCGLVVTIAGDAVLYYPAQSASSLVVYERGHLTAPEVFTFGVWMTLLAAAVVLGVALPYWGLVGEPIGR
jgi:anion transporter